MNTEQKAQLLGLLRKTEASHRAATSGEDPDWPLWYADHLQQPLREILGVPFTRSEIVYCLVKAEAEREVRAAGSDRAEFLAAYFAECFAESRTAAKDRLALYYSTGCGYCWRVLQAIDRLGLDVERREIFENPDYRRELVAARGRATVPVLRITSPDGEDRWMPESRDIVRYLERLPPGAAA